MPTHAGIVLAAGASSRMGEPKALLETPAGSHLAGHQASLLSKSGCDPVLIVLGCEAQRIRLKLDDLKVVENSDWEKGRMTSILAGLKALPPCEGVFILPVDTVGVTRSTIKAMTATAEREQPAAVRPFYEDEEGKVLWLSRTLIENLIRQEPDPNSFRLDEIVRPIAYRIDVDDPAILHNVNTPEEWKSVRDRWPEDRS